MTVNSNFLAPHGFLLGVLVALMFAAAPGFAFANPCPSDLPRVQDEEKKEAAEGGQDSKKEEG